MASTVEVRNETSIVKGATSEPGRLDFVEKTRKEISSYEDNKHYTLVKSKELNIK